MLQSHQTVLNSWERGLTSGEIGALLNLHASHVRTIVQRARKNGDKRAHKRHVGPARSVSVTVPREIIIGLYQEAEKRKLTDVELAAKLLTTALSANLVSAILDDGEGA